MALQPIARSIRPYSQLSHFRSYSASCSATWVRFRRFKALMSQVMTRHDVIFFQRRKRNFIGHGTIMALIAGYMIWKERQMLADKKMNEMVKMLFGGRYIVFLMGIFSSELLLLPTISSIFPPTIFNTKYSVFHYFSQSILVLSTTTYFPNRSMSLAQSGQFPISQESKTGSKTRLKLIRLP